MERNRLHVRSPYVDRRRTSLISVAYSDYERTSVSLSNIDINAYCLIVMASLKFNSLASEFIQFVDPRFHRFGDS